MPQLVRLRSSPYVMYCTYRWADSEVDGVRLASPTIGYLSVGCPVRRGWSRGVPTTSSSRGSKGWYAGKIVEDTDGSLLLLAWRRFDEDGNIVGEISGPMPIEHDGASFRLSHSVP